MYSKTLVILSTIFIACLISANIVATKIVGIGNFFLPAGIVVFPISYIIGDVLTEIYGYQKTKSIILLGFLANLIVVAVVWMAQIIPAAPFWDKQSSYDAILGQTPRLVLASFVAYLLGSLSNSWTMEKIKSVTGEKMLWVRTITSTILGEGLDTLLFLVIGFAGILGSAQILSMIITQWLCKVIYEIVATPFTYAVIGALKKRGIKE